MVVGESGLGKTTLVNTLFNSPLYPTKEAREPTPEVPKTIDIQTISAGEKKRERDKCVRARKVLAVGTPKSVVHPSQSLDIEENGVKLKLTIIDTPGFGDFINNEDSWRPILENIEARYDAYLEQENRVNRKRLVDTRVHACLYFIAPSGHS